MAETIHHRSIKDSNSYVIPVVLLSPERARELGIAAESPVFTEVNVHLPNSQQSLQEKGIDNSVVLFQSGQRTEAPNRSLYLLDADLPSDPFDDTDKWFAKVKPVTLPIPSLIGYKTHGVEVEEIFLKCSKTGDRINEGALYSSLYGQLFPDCLNNRHQNYFSNQSPSYSFLQREGVIQFSR